MKRLLTKRRTRIKSRGRKVVVSVNLFPEVAHQIAIRAEKLGISRSVYVGQILEATFENTKFAMEVASDPLLMKQMQSFLLNPRVLDHLGEAAKEHFTNEQLQLFERLVEKGKG